jgi:hypothetical protein
MGLGVGSEVGFGRFAEVRHGSDEIETEGSISRRYRPEI